ncbi:MAG: InlB B-repeat-containing protein [Clostridia bacterium]|nr:InlB B-repeat-containing protein [Clostridia bacterium]
MKKVKKLLCILLATVMLATSMASTASAYEAYTTPAGYDSLGKPYYTYEQSCSMLLDFLDKVLYDANINEVVDLSILGTITINLTSVDNTFKSISDLLDMGLINVAQGLSLVGDLKDLDESAIVEPRRTTHADSVVFYALLEFLSDNRPVLEKLVNGTIDLGGIMELVIPPDDPDMGFIYDIPAFLKEMIYTLIYNSVIKAESEPEIDALPAGVTIDSFTIDGLLQEVVDSFIIGDYNVSTQSYTGFLPSMLGKTSITSGSTYDLIQNAIDSLMVDILVPTLVESLPETLDIEVSEEWPYGNPAEPGLLPTIIGIINDYLKLGYPYDAEEYPVIELEKALTWLLAGETVADASGNVTKTPAALYTILSFTDHGIDINDEIYANIVSLLRELGPGLLQMLLPEVIPEDMEFPDMTEWTTDQFISYIIQLIAPGIDFFAGVRFLPDCDTIQECLTYILISLVIDLLPENDYYGMIEDGTLDPENGAWIEIGTDYLIYLINSLIDINIPADSSFEEFVDCLANWLVAEFGFIFNTKQNLAGMTCWEKLDATLFTVLDPTLTTIQKTHDTVSESLIVGAILDGVQTLNIEKILSFIGKNSSPDAILNQPVVNFVLDLLGDILSSLMNGLEIIPASTQNLEDLLYGTTKGGKLGQFAGNLLSALYSEKDYNFPTLIPLVGSLIGLSQNDNFIVNAPVGYPNKTINDLKKLVQQYMPSNDGLTYSDEGYFFYGEEDYEYLFEFTNFDDTYSECVDLINRYNENPNSVTPLEIKNLYYRLGYYYERMTPRSEKCKIQLAYEINYAEANNAETNDNGEGGKIYTDRSWRLYSEALDNAYKVAADPDAKQSAISVARQELFKAQNRLKSYISLARYNVLDVMIKRAEAIPEEDYRLYTTHSIAEFKSAYAEAISIDRDYDIDDQYIVDEVSTRLGTALNSLEFWELNYELGSEIIIDEVVSKDTKTILKFRESTGAAVTNVSATVNGGATIGEMYEEGGYYCWEIDPAAATLYTVITATIKFTQPSTGMEYTAYAYTFVSAGNYEINFDVNTCYPGYIRNKYHLGVYGIQSTDYNGVLDYSVDHNWSGSAGDCATVPMGTVYADRSQYRFYEEIPGLMFTFTKYADSYSAGNIGSGVFSSINVDVTSSNPDVTVDPASYGVTLNQDDSKNFTFAGNLPAAGETATTLITPTVTATATNGGQTISYPKFYLRVISYDKSVLRETVNAAIESCRQEWFYSGGWEIYKKDLEAAVAVLNNPMVVQAQIDEANLNLIEAIDWLEYKSADFEELHKLISIANSLNPDDYQDFSAVTDILKSIDFSQDVLQQSLVNEIIDNLKAAIDNLAPAQDRIIIRCYDNSGILYPATVIDDEGNEVPQVILLSTDYIYGDIGEKVIVNVPEMMGYKSTDKAQLVTITKGGVVVEFNYAPDVYRVILNANGGTVDPVTVNVAYGSTYTGLPVPTRDGFEFVGWYNKLSGGIKVDDTVRVTTGYYSTLYARWKRVVTNDAELNSDNNVDTGVTQPEETITQNFFDKIFDFFTKLFEFFKTKVFNFI